MGAESPPSRWNPRLVVILLGVKKANMSKDRWTVNTELLVTNNLSFVQSLKCEVEF